MPPLLQLQDIRLSLGSAPLLDGADLQVGSGERIALVGRNGSGKSTLLRVAAGTVAIDGGKRFLQPGTTVSVLQQEPDLAGHASVGAYVEAGLGPDGDRHRARLLLDELGLDPERTPDGLSGGEARRAALVRVIAPEPDLLLLDEPTNHLDLPAIEWLERTLAGMRAGLVLISHDRRLLATVGRATVWLDGGRTRRLDRGFAHFEPWRDALVAEEELARHKLDRQIVREEDWMRYGVTARRKRNVRRVAELAGLRARRRDATARAGVASITSLDAGLSGRQVVVAEHVTHAWPGAAPLVRDLELRVLRGDRLGIVGANGAGKSTLLGLFTGLIAPEAGTVVRGASLALATLDQQRRALDPAATLADTLTGGRGDTVEVAGEKRHVIGVMKDFLFRPEQARTPVGILSGGERGRLALATALLGPSNLLVLDEPTNDLDLETLDLLEELVSSYAGTVLLVSHDRDFLDRVATSVLLAEGDGRWIEYAGGWSDMLAQRGGRSPFAPTGGARGRGDPGRSGGAGADPARRDAPRKLSFKDTRDLANLPRELERLRGEIARLEASLADQDLFRRDPAGFAERTARLGRTNASLAGAEERWLELEIKREAIDAGRA